MQKVKIIVSALIILFVFSSFSLLFSAENSLKDQKSFQKELTEAKSYYNLGLTYYGEGNYKKAIYNLEIARERYKLLGDFKTALEIENYINTLSIKEAFREVNCKINDLVQTVDSLRDEIAVLTSKVDSINK